jgi:hypothetical protein
MLPAQEIAIMDTCRKETRMPLLDLFWTMLWLVLFFLWIWLLISLFGDVFRRDDISGWGKAGWIILLFILPLLGALIYLIANGDDMARRRIEDLQAAQAAQASYIRSVAGGGASKADELEKLARLRDQGVISNEEFEAQKAAMLG